MYCPLLQSVDGLPSTVQTLSVYQSESLEIIKTTSNLVQIDSMDCKNLVEVEGYFKSVGIENVDKRIIKNMGLLDFQLEDKVFKKIKVRYEYGIFSTIIPGKELVESWFDYIDRSGSSSISFIVPDNNNSKKRRIRGLNVCSAYHVDYRFPTFHDECKISNTTKDLQWIYNWCGYLSWRKDGIMLSHWRLGNLLEVGDHLTVELPLGIIKEIGLKVVYEEEEDDDDERKEATTSGLYTFNNHKEDIVTLSWTEDEEEERNSYLHLSDCHAHGNTMFLCHTHLVDRTDRTTRTLEMWQELQAEMDNYLRPDL